MPDEPLLDDDGNLYEAYLAEVRSIGGLSGSPVFVLMERRKARLRMRPIEFSEEIDIEYLDQDFVGAPEAHLLGMVRGHWDLKRQDEDSVYREADASSPSL